MSGIIRTHVKRKIAAVLLATMLLDQFPVTVYAEPLESEALAEPAGQEQPAPEESQPVTEEQTGSEETEPVANEQAGSDEAASVADEQAGSDEATPAADEQAGSEETASADTPGAGGEDTAEEAAGTQENISYKDENGADQNCNNYTVLEGTETSLNPGWYVVKQDKAYTKPVILNGPGEYHIILTDGKTMIVSK